MENDLTWKNVGLALIVCLGILSFVGIIATGVYFEQQAKVEMMRIQMQKCGCKNGN